MASQRGNPALSIIALILLPTASFCQHVTTTGSEAALCQFAKYHFHPGVIPAQEKEGTQ